MPRKTTMDQEATRTHRREYGESKQLHEVLTGLTREHGSIFKKALPRGAELRFKLEFDEDGEPVLGTWVVLDDKAPEAHNLDAQDRIEAEILAIASTATELPRPLVRFRLKSEQDHLEQESHAA